MSQQSKEGGVAREEARSLVEEALAKDERLRDVLAGLPSRGNGAYHFDWNFLMQSRFVPVPAPVLERYGEVVCKTFAGLLPPLRRAFVAFDNKLVLWHWQTGELVPVDALGQIIVAVALAKPRHGVFGRHVAHLLVVATPVEVVLFTVEYEDEDAGADGAIRVRKTNYSVSTDNVQMTRIITTREGRILCTGRDGCLYEIVYARDPDYAVLGDTDADERVSAGTRRRRSCAQQLASAVLPRALWQPRKCRKLNHSRGVVSTVLGSLARLVTGTGGQAIVDCAVDERVGLVWCLLQDQSVQVYQLGAPGTTASMPLTLTHVVQRSARLLGGSTGVSSSQAGIMEQRVVAIRAVPQHVSREAGAVLITHHGHRIFLRRPVHGSGLRVAFVRQCPPQLQGDSQRRFWEPCHIASSSPNDVHRAFVLGDDADLVLLADARDVAQDTLVALTRDASNVAPEAVAAPPGARPLMECVATLPLEGRVVDAAALPVDAFWNVAAASLYAQGQPRPLLGLHPLATQHVLEPARLVVLTATGVHELSQLRPLDELALLLRRYLEQLAAPVAVDRFVKRHGNVETCAMLLALACQSDNVAASTAASLQAQYNAAQDVLGRGERVDARLAEAALQFFVALGALVLPAGSEAGLGSQQASSARHQALALLLARLLRPLWRWSLFEASPRVCTRFDADQLRQLCAPLVRLQKVVQRLGDALYPEVVDTPDGTTESETQQLRLVAQRERLSIEALLRLLARSIEACRVMEAFAQYDDATREYINKTMSAEDRVQLLRLQFCHVVTAEEGEKSLRQAILGVFQTRDLTASVEARRQLAQLHQACPSFLGADDVLLLQARQRLADAALLRADDRRAALQAALRRYLRAVQHSGARVDLFPLERVTGELLDAEYYSGAMHVIRRVLHQLQQQQQQQHARSDTVIGAGDQSHVGAPSSLESRTVGDTGSVTRVSGGGSVTRGHVDPSATALLDAGMSFSASALNTTYETDAFNAQLRQLSGDELAKCQTRALQQVRRVVAAVCTPPTDNGEIGLVAAAAASDDDGATERVEAIRVALASPSVALHACVYEWFLARDACAELFSLRPPFLEKHLRLQHAPRHWNVLVQYYLGTSTVHPLSKHTTQATPMAQPAHAAMLLRHMALRDDMDLLLQQVHREDDPSDTVGATRRFYGLQQRLQHLSLAVTCARSALHVRARSSGSEATAFVDSLSAAEDAVHETPFGRLDKSVLVELEDRLALARLQSHVAQQLHAAPLPPVAASAQSEGERSAALALARRQRDDLLEQLEARIFGIDRLFELCAQYHLYTAALSCLHCASSNDTLSAMGESQGSVRTLAESVYERIFGQLLEEAGTDGVTPEARWTRLRHLLEVRVRQLAAQFADSPVVFPLEYLAQKLEEINFQHCAHPRSDFAAPLLVDVGAPLPALLHAYETVCARALAAQPADEVLTPEAIPSDFARLCVEAAARLLEHAAHQAPASDLEDTTGGGDKVRQNALSLADSILVPLRAAGNLDDETRALMLRISAARRALSAASDGAPLLLTAPVASSVSVSSIGGSNTSAFAAHAGEQRASLTW